MSEGQRQFRSRLLWSHIATELNVTPPDTPRAAISRKVREHRAELGITQAALAKGAGVNQVLVGSMELYGRAYPKALHTVLVYLGIIRPLWAAQRRPEFAWAVYGPAGRLSCGFDDDYARAVQRAQDAAHYFSLGTMCTWAVGSLKVEREAISYDRSDAAVSEPRNRAAVPRRKKRTGATR